MRQYINILSLSLILLSCSQNRNEKLNGYWRLNNDEGIESLFFPFELCFENDSLYITDRFNFQQHVKIQIDNDSIKLIFPRGKILKMKLSIFSDSAIVVGEGKYLRIPEGYQSNIHSYDLIGYKTDKILENITNSDIIHLIKINGITQVILNDVTTDLKTIPDFLVTSDEYGSPQYLILYLGKEIELKDLLEAYEWINVAGINRVTLVTGNEAIEKFYVLNDFIDINDSLMDTFLMRKKNPPFPPSSIENTEVKRKIIKIDNQTDFEKLTTINDSTEYLIQVNYQLDLTGYLELIEIISDKKNVKKEITVYNRAGN